MVDEWLQNELAVSFHVSLQCVSCELKFFTGLAMRGSTVLEGSAASFRQHQMSPKTYDVMTFVCPVGILFEKSPSVPSVFHKIF